MSRMNGLTNGFVLVFSAAVLLAASTAPAIAQEGAYDDNMLCGYVDESFCGGGGHKLPPTGGGKSGGHMECMVCISGGATCHGNCTIAPGGFALGGRVTPSMAAAYTVALGAAMSGDVDEVVRQGLRAGGYVVFNELRGVVQVISCNGTAVVASLQLESRRQVARARNLPDAGTAYLAFVGNAAAMRALASSQRPVGNMQ